MRPQGRPLILDEGDKVLDAAAARGQREVEEHEEEEEGPERRHVHLEDGRGVDDEGQLDAVLHGVLDLLAGAVGEEADDAEHDEAGVDGGARVEERDEQAVAERVVVDPVVGGEDQLTAEPDAEREADLRGRLGPDLELEQAVPLRRDVELDALVGARELRGVDDEGGEDEVGREGDDVGGLAVGLDALDEHQGDEGPAAGQAQDQLPPGDTVVLQVVGGAVLGPLHVQSQAEPVEVVLRRRDGVLVDHRGYTLCHIVEFVDAGGDCLVFVVEDVCDAFEVVISAVVEKFSAVLPGK